MKRSQTISRVCAQPSPWTFTIPPISKWMDAHLKGCKTIVDPFCGESRSGTHNNDLANGGIDAVDFLRGLAEHGEVFDAALLDPPYSPRQTAEVYRSVGRKGQDVSQNAKLYSECGFYITQLVKHGGVCLKFGWNSSAPGRGFVLVDTLIVCHGGAHNDTICTAWRADHGMFGTAAHKLAFTEAAK